jgi:hypothetical protein
MVVLECLSMPAHRKRKLHELRHLGIRQFRLRMFGSSIPTLEDRRGTSACHWLGQETQEVDPGVDSATTEWSQHSMRL